jgi:hypothetical protein
MVVSAGLDAEGTASIVRTAWASLARGNGVKIRPEIPLILGYKH